MKDRQQIDGFLKTQGDLDYSKNGYGKLPDASAVQDFLRPPPPNKDSSTGKDSGSKAKRKP